jgi:hypothetical protein
MIAAKPAQIGKRFGKADLYDLFYLFPLPKITACDDRNDPLVPVKDLFERGAVTGEHEIDKLPVGPLDINRHIGRIFVASMGDQSLVLQNRRVTAHPDPY